MLRLLAGLLLVILLPGDSMAQDVPGSLEELLRTGDLSSGEVVSVTVANRGRFSGPIVDLTSTRLVMAPRSLTQGRTRLDFREGTRVDFSEDEILSIERPDSLENGIWIGLAGAMIPLCLYARSSEGASYWAFYLGGPVIGAGVVTGALIDAAVKRAIYRRRDSTRVSWSPTLSTEGVGARVSLEW